MGGRGLRSRGLLRRLHLREDQRRPPLPVVGLHHPRLPNAKRPESQPQCRPPRGARACVCARGRRWTVRPSTTSITPLRTTAPTTWRGRRMARHIRADGRCQCMRWPRRGHALYAEVRASTGGREQHGQFGAGHTQSLRKGNQSGGFFCTRDELAGGQHPLSSASAAGP